MPDRVLQGFERQMELIIEGWMRDTPVSEDDIMDALRNLARKLKRGEFKKFREQQSV
jgi:hypothetical protein